MPSFKTVHRAHSAHAKFRPHLEALESRDLPAAPVITMNIEMLEGKQVHVYGTVTDESPSTVSIELSGQVNVSVVPGRAMNGVVNYSYKAIADGLGTITATATDNESLTDSESDVLTSEVPEIVDFMGEEQPGDWWVFSGRVLDESPEGLTVTLTGIPTANGPQTVTAIVGADGWFYYTVQLPHNASGTVLADVSDWWGQAADQVGYLVY